ncbi:PD40 domain-containing protein [bacterium]|nr:PD40 domain-containing protein [bacterium]
MAVLLAGTAAAQVDVVKGPVRHTFAVTGFTGDASLSAQVADVLRNDLQVSGHFTLTSTPQAEFVQQGTVRLEGDRTGVIECTVVLQATHKIVHNGSYKGSPQDLRRMVHRLADDIVEKIAGERGIAQSRIAFVLRRGKIKELAVMDYDGHNVRQLTFDKGLNVRPRWSPDGRKILYTSYLHRFMDVIEADLYTGGRRRVAGFNGLNSGAVYSPDGRSIALTLSKDGNPELYLMDAGGGGLRRLTRTKGAESSPTWTTDGRGIAYVSDDRGSPQVYLVSREGGEPSQLTFSPSYNTEPAWSRPAPESTMKPMLAVTSRVGGRFQIGLYDSGTKEVRPLVADGHDNSDPSWGRDGRHLVFSKIKNWRSRLVLLDVVTGEQVELPVAQGDASEPAWGP